MLRIGTALFFFLAKATPAALGTLLKAEVEKWAPIIRKSGVYAD